jgi:hypothetical protein
MRLSTASLARALRRFAEWVMGFHDLSQPLGQNMRVNLRRGYVGMAQHLLDRSQIGAPGEQMARKGVAQHMR